MKKLLVSFLAALLTLAAFNADAQTRFDLGTQARYGSTNWSAAQAFFPAGSDTLPSISFLNDPDTGLSSAGSNSFDFVAGASRFARLFNTGITVGSDVNLGWSSSTTPSAAADLIITRDAANTIAQRNGTNAQAHRVYNTFTDASNYERAKLAWESNAFVVGTEAAGTGTGTRSIQFQTNGILRWTMDGNGNITGGTGRSITLAGTTSGTITSPLYATATNCSSSASPAVCANASAGSVNIAAAATTITVNTTSVTANSQIFIQEDSSLGTKLGVTCNTTTGRIYTVTARTAGTSFVITASAAPVTNPACLSYFIVN